LKVRVRVEDFSSRGMSPNDRRFLKKYVVILIDSNILQNIAYAEGSETLKRLMTNWSSLKPKTICSVCDFIRIECYNFERFKYQDARIRHFLKDAAESKEGLYVEFVTPIKKISAEDRLKLVDLFPKAYRRVLIKDYGALSGTDSCLLLLAMYLKAFWIQVCIATQDETLLRASQDFGIRCISV